MCPLVVVVFGWMIGLQEFVHHHKHSDHQLPHLVLDWCVGSNFVGYQVGSIHAGNSCDSGVPFYGRYSTQLHVDPSVFHPLFLIGGILLEGHILLVA